VKVIAGELSDQDCRDFASAVRGEKIPPENDNLRVNWLVKNEVLNEPAKIGELFDRAKADPLEPVRTTAPNIIFARFYATHGQFTNAINICREAIASDPKDDWCYNLLAWIEATCPDSSVRDGKEAISLATKACELTRWQEPNWIDTLAAAYAESGDFQHAIEIQEQALRAASEPQQKAMRERLALYKQSLPYREKP
jgi:tetratricopeptide (TPR) repeat protein